MMDVFFNRLPYRFMLEIYNSSILKRKITSSNLIYNLKSAYAQTFLILKVMEQAGLIRKEEKDGRTNYLYLTEKGLALAKEISLIKQALQ